MIVEARPIKEALMYVTIMSFTHIVIETNSLSLRNILTKTWKIPWEIIELIEDITDMMQSRNMVVRHINREANQLADITANTTVQTETKLTYITFQ